MLSMNWALDNGLILDTWRKEALNLIARHIGLRSLQGNSADLAVIQQIIDRDILAEDQIREWQYLGVVFGGYSGN